MTRTIKGSVLALAILGICATVPATSTTPKKGEASAIQAVLDAQVAAWNRRDLEGFMKGYWNSDQLSFYSGGTKTAGWKGTNHRYQLTYMSQGREMGQLTFSDLQIEILGKDSAFVRGHWRLKMSNSEPNGLFTLIFRKFNDGWKIVHDHTGAAA